MGSSPGCAGARSSISYGAWCVRDGANSPSPLPLPALRPSQMSKNKDATAFPDGDNLFEWVGTITGR